VNLNTLSIAAASFGIAKEAEKPIAEGEEIAH
jgi:hypothetical protein